MYELTITRLIDAPREKLFRAWTDPALIPRWFCPPPWGVSEAKTDVRTGGSTLIVMRGPEGQEVPNRGVYLEVVPNEKLSLRQGGIVQGSGHWLMEEATAQVVPAIARFID